MPSRVGISRLVTTQSNLPTMMVRCVVGAMTRALTPRHQCCVQPAIADGRDGISRRTWPVPSRFAVEPAVTDRPLLVGTPTRARAAPSELHPAGRRPALTPPYPAYRPLLQLFERSFQRCNTAFPTGNARLTDHAA